MAEVVPDIDDQSYQLFISESPWSHSEVLDQVAHDVDAAFGDPEDRFLVIDESAIAKKGNKSVGVARQWNGRLGKADNCQVGVFAGLGCGGDVTLTDERLYLPQEWIDAPNRCDRAGLPQGERIFRTKAQLALAMIRHARSQKIRYRWVGFDGGYGKEHEKQHHLQLEVTGNKSRSHHPTSLQVLSVQWSNPAGEAVIHTTTEVYSGPTQGWITKRSGDSK